MDIQKQKDEVLRFSLRHVPFDGWTEKALKRGAVDAGIDADDVMPLFHHDMINVIKHFHDFLDREMLLLAEPKLADLRIRDKVACCVMTRIDLMTPHREAIRKAAMLLAMPQNAALSLSLVGDTVDKIWYACGDKSTDFNYYSKRFLLGGVYTSTVLYWMNDHSQNCESTLQFLHRRIENVMGIEKIKKSVRTMLPWFGT